MEKFLPQALEFFLLFVFFMSLLLFFVFFDLDLSSSSLSSLFASSTSFPFSPFSSGSLLLSCPLRRLLLRPLCSFWGIKEIFPFQTFSMWFSYCYFFQTLMNAPLYHPFVTWTRSATIPLALTAVLATLDTLATAKLAQVRKFGRIMSWKEITMS